MGDGETEQSVVPVAAAPATAKRRWFRFSLRTLVVFVLLVGSGMLLRHNRGAWKRAWRLDHPIARFSPDGTRIVAWGFDAARLYDSASGKLLPGKFGAPSGEDGVRAAACSPNNRYIATFTDRCAWVHEAGTGAERFARTTEGNYTAVAFCPQSKLVAFAETEEHPNGENRVWVRIFDIESAREVRCVAPHPFDGFACVPDIRLIFFSPNGKWMATSDDARGGIVLWDLEPSRKDVYLKNYQDDRIFDLDFADDGEHVFGWGTPRRSSDCRKLTWAIGVEEPIDVSLDTTREYRTTRDGELAIRRWWVCRPRRPEYWWGIAWLPEFWLTVVFGLAFVWSVRRDRKTL